MKKKEILLLAVTLASGYLVACSNNNSSNNFNPTEEIKNEENIADDEVTLVDENILSEEIAEEDIDPANELLLALENKEYGRLNQLLSNVGENNVIIMSHVEDIYNRAIEFFNNSEYSDAEKWMKVVCSCYYMDSKDYVMAISIMNDLDGEKLSKKQVEEFLSFERFDLLSVKHQTILEKIKYQYDALHGCFKKPAGINGKVTYYYHKGDIAYWGQDDFLGNSFTLYYFIQEDVWRDIAKLHVVSNMTNDNIKICNEIVTRIERSEMPTVFNEAINSQEKTIEEQNKEAYEEYKKYLNDNQNKSESSSNEIKNDEPITNNNSNEYTGSYDAVLEYNDTSGVLICSSEESMARFMMAVSNGNKGTLTELFAEGKVTYTAQGTKCNIVKRKSTKCQVKLLDGLFAGETVWVIIESIHEK